LLPVEVVEQTHGLEAVLVMVEVHQEVMYLLVMALLFKAVHKLQAMRLDKDNLPLIKHILRLLVPKGMVAVAAVGMAVMLIWQLVVLIPTV
jgi:hypothetical protein